MASPFDSPLLLASAEPEFTPQFSKRFNGDTASTISYTIPGSFVLSPGSIALSMWIKRSLTDPEVTTIPEVFFSAVDSTGKGVSMGFNRFNQESYLQVSSYTSTNVETRMLLLGNDEGVSSGWVFNNFIDTTNWFHIFWTGFTIFINGTSRPGPGIILQSADPTIDWTGNNWTITYGSGKLKNRAGTAGTRFFHGYIAEAYFLRGTSFTSYNGGATAADFGFFDTKRGEPRWVPKKYAGIYRTGTHYLEMKTNPSGSTWFDSSPNGNHFTASTANPADQVVDVPYTVVSNVSDPGTGFSVRGNYCNLIGYLNAYYGLSDQPIFSRGSLAVCPLGLSNNVYATSQGTMSLPGGKWYFEGRIIGATTQVVDRFRIGLITSNYDQNQLEGRSTDVPGLGNTLNTWGFAANGTTLQGRTNNVVTNIDYPVKSSFVANDVLMCAYDADTNKVWFGVNGVWGEPNYGGLWNYDPNTIFTGLPYNIIMSSDGRYQYALAGSYDNLLYYYSSEDYGATWFKINAIFADSTFIYTDTWTDIAVSKGNGQYLLVRNERPGTTHQLFASNNYGETWTQTETNRFWEKFAISSNGQYQTAIVYNGQIYRNDNYGNTNNWTPVEVNRQWRAIAMSSSGQYQAAVVERDANIRPALVVTSNDFGQTWTTKVSIDNSYSWRDVAISDNGQYQTALTFHYTIGATSPGIHNSTDFGNTWTLRSIITGTYNLLKISSNGLYQYVTVRNTSNVWAVYRSTNGGTSWAAISTLGGQIIYSIDISNDGRFVAVMTSVDLYVSRDFGATWTQKTIPGPTLKNGEIAMSADGRYVSALVDEYGISVKQVAEPSLDSLPLYLTNTTDDKLLPGVSFKKGSSTETSVTTNVIEMNFGQRPYAYQAPSGFKSLCSSNLPEPLIPLPKTDFITNFRAGTSSPVVDIDAISTDDGVGVVANTTQPFDCALTPNDQYLLTVVRDNNKLTRNAFSCYNTVDNILGTYQFSNILNEPAGDFRPRGIVITPDSKQAYITSPVNNRLLEVNLTKLLDWIERTNVRVEQWYRVAISSSGQYQIIGAESSSGDLFISSDYGRNWVARSGSGNPLPGGQSYEGVAISADGQRQTAVIDGGRIWRSFDFGNNWEVVASDTTNRAWKDVAMSSTGQYQTGVLGTTGTGRGIWVSSDFGENWTNVLTVSNPVRVAVSSTGQYQTICTNNGQIWRSADSGQNWQAVETNRTWKSVAMSSTGEYQTAVVTGGQVYRSTDFGQTWNLITNSALPASAQWNDVAMSSNGEQQIAVIQDGLIFISENYGVTWSPIVKVMRWKGIAMSANGQYKTAVAAVASGILTDATSSIFTNENNGEPLFKIINSSNLNQPQYIDVSPDGENLYIANQGNNTLLKYNRNTLSEKVYTTLASPLGVKVSPDGKLVFTTNTSSNTITVLDTETEEVIDINTNIISEGLGWTITDQGLEDPWSVGIQTTDVNQTFSVNIASGTGPNITIDWGDGTVQNYTTTGVKTRTYASAGSYTVKISGSFASGGNIRLGDSFAQKARVQLTSVISTIPGLISFNSTFQDCTSLTSIPAGLFDNNTAVTNFSQCFRGCSSLTSIPAGLFDNNTAVIGFGSTFFGCTSLTSIPSGLFDNNTAVTNFILTFIGCSSLTSIPAGLFANNTSVTSFDSTFFGCTSLTSIPAGLFDNNTAVFTFAVCFRDCSSLTSIPAGLFANNTAVINFNQCFRDCSSLTSIPAGLFDNNTAVNTFDSAFRGCFDLTTIPAGLFDNNTAVTTFSQCFRDCTSLTSIPAGLFDNNTSVTGFSQCFRDCSSLTTVPSGLFANNTSVTSFDSTFFGVTLTTVSYSDLLINIASNAASRQNNVLFGGGGSKYNLAGQTARQTLEAKSWSFTDGGLE